MYKQKITLYPLPIFIILLLLYWLAALFIQPQLGSLLLIFDSSELFLERGYFSQSRWLDTSLIAYQDYLVEYPPMGLYSYSLPRLFFNIYSEQDFLYAFTFIALFPILAIFFLLLKRQPNWVLFLCTPTFFYYGLCRFDTFPALASLLAVLYILDKKPMFGAFFLGLAIGIKYYPIVMVLPLLALQENKVKWSLILVGSAIFFCFHHILLLDWSHALATYTFHTEPGTNREGLLYLLGKYLMGLELLSANINDTNLSPIIRRVFFMMQLVPAFILAGYLYRHKVAPSREILAISAIISIFSFIFFAKFHSPQGLIWVLPFIILLADKIIIWVYVLLDVINYIVIVMVSNIVSQSSGIFDLFNLGRMIITIVVMFLVIKKLQQIVHSQAAKSNSMAGYNG